ncbi:Chloride channel protein isoform 2 [Scophthalmus maximus]|uniref:Chloride channel protein isoform 2 n=1 Tax=Scophthalmus maximus TaxID=52904 RepID=A0A2U9BYR8_SCOMX|nr:Chloride channel protein isoform 2 [Scophthalmus maximus]
MKSLDEAPGSERDRESKNPERGNRYETSHYKSALLSDPWKPCRRPRAIVKEWLLTLRCCLGAMCGMEWYSYAALGIVMAFLSFLMDLSVTKLLSAHQWLYMKLEGNSLLQFVCWTLYPACLCAVASSFSHNICPFSTGSGIPEVRTMLSGIEMPHYLSLTNMFAKFLGLICTLAAGSTVFLGKVGPFVHLSTMVGSYLSKFFTPVQANKKDKAAGEMLVVAAAVGVASCFGAPVSGVLFSVEVMSSHFALTHYVPCFFAAACGALTFRLFTVWSGDEETLQALFKTNFPTALPFYPLEILLFAFLGLLCGAASCCYLSCHRWILQFTKTNPVFIKMLATEKGLYSGMVAFLLASVTFPNFAGQYMASKYTMKQLLTSLLDSRQWSSQFHNASVHLEPEPLLEWSSPGSPVYLPLAFFLLMKMWMLVLACTLPVPAGYFMPVFVYGAALGRLHAEGVAYVFSSGVTSGQQWASINPGGYALAGAAALSGAVTHTLSPALLAIELTGQFSHAGPVLLATLLANALARSGHRSSFYDALSVSKRLPHLPSLKRACPQLPSVAVGQFLGVKPIQLQKAAGPAEIEHAVKTSSQTQIPVVDSHESPILLGFVLRSELRIFLRHAAAETLEKHLDEVCCVRPASVLLSPHSTVQEAHGVLSLVGDQTLYVTERGRLVGLLTWSEMKKILEDLAREI